MKIAIVGLGYVGLPLSLQFARSDVSVLGLDIDPVKVDLLNKGRSFIKHITDEAVTEQRHGQRLEASTDFARIKEVEAVIICVPTPLNKNREPDISYVLATGRSIAPHLQKGTLVVLESTTYPGTTDEDLRQVLEEGSGLRAGTDFHLAFSPEREDPGNPQSVVKSIPKVIGGYTPACLERTKALYGRALDTLVPVSSCRAAEATKLLENIFRSVNIALVNELALLSERMGIDLWEVIEAAKTKPFGFMPFYPGPGVGGHCIPVDPYYLSWKAREYDFYTKFIELAAEVNLAMPYHVVDIVSQALGQEGKVLAGSRVLVLGVAFKRDVDDARNSPAERIIELLLRKGANVSYSDPYVPRYRVGSDVFCPEEHWLEHVELDDEVLGSTDCAVIVAGHRVVDYRRLLNKASLVVDTDNSTRGLNGGARVVRIGAPLETLR
jgi:UDP-N-acetyl-D-glucosamine dehydrogenase